MTNFSVSRYDGFRNQSNAVYFQEFMRIHPRLQLLFSGRYDAYNRYSFLYPVVNGVEVITPNSSIFNQNPFTWRVGLNSQLLSFFSRSMDPIRHRFRLRPDYPATDRR